ncbi:MAG: DegT/DnrJ/EryC1/StrS family aminotransferase [Chloroflexi bacterium]|nr:DegT/DnrJ/EryC1/StrS family aminotransferase [Chloroflexota bacterium]
MRAATTRKPIPIAEVLLDDTVIEMVGKVMRSGNLRCGPMCAELEQRFAEIVGAEYAVAVSSGTAALHVAGMALLSAGDEVLVPAFTFIASASAIILAGARPILVDVDPKTLIINIEDACRKITARTKAIVPVHLYGNSVDVPQIQRLANDYGLRVIWDAAQAFGTRYGDSDVGALGDATCYSFYPTKNITTGEGGMITTPSKDIAEMCRALRSHGEVGKYVHHWLGLNYRMTDISAAIGVAQLHSAPQLLKQRRQNAEILRHELRDLPGVSLPVETPNSVHSYNLFTVQLDESTLGVSRDNFAAQLLKEGVQSAVHYPRPLNRQPALQTYGPFGELPASEAASQRVLSIPVHPGLRNGELEEVIRAVRRVHSKVSRSSIEW